MLPIKMAASCREWPTSTKRCTGMPRRTVIWGSGLDWTWHLQSTELSEAPAAAQISCGAVKPLCRTLGWLPGAAVQPDRQPWCGPYRGFHPRFMLRHSAR